MDLPDELKTFFVKWKAKRGSGVPQIQNLLEVDPTKPHPFRKYPEGHPMVGQPIMGRPRMFFVVEDGQGELYVDGNGKLRVVGGHNSKVWRDVDTRCRCTHIELQARRELTMISWMRSEG